MVIAKPGLDGHDRGAKIIARALRDAGMEVIYTGRILEGLRANGAEDVLVVLGGTIPAEDAEELKAQGVAAVFTPGAPTSEIVEFLRSKVAA